MAQSRDKMSEIDEHITRRFDIQKRLGKGAYGIVWKAIDRKTKEVVAVKKIFDAFRNQTDAQRTFREIMFLQSFKRHPNIIKLHSIHRAANNRDIYLGFEYMETDLHNVIKRGNILKDIHKRYIMYQLFKATKYIHSGNVIHRDQKPSNVLLDSLCRCKIADFGLARSLTQISDGSPSDTDPTLTDYVATRWYRAPEILIANRHYTKGIDMWSLGCILGEMLAEKPIFPGSSTVNQVERIMATIPVPTHEDIKLVCPSGVGSSMIKNACSGARVSLKSILGADCSPDAVDLLNRLLVFNPMKRLTAEEALEHDFVEKFHDPCEEITMDANVIIPLNDDVRLSVDDYRNKLYEIMATHNAARSKTNPSKISHTKIIPDVRPKVAKDTERYIKSRCYQLNKEKPYNTQSESKIVNKSKLPQSKTLVNKSDSKLSKQTLQMPLESKIGKAYGDHVVVRKQAHSSSEISQTNSRGKVCRKPMCSKSNVYPPLNSYNQNHGIITQSALMQLRAAGMR